MKSLRKMKTSFAYSNLDPRSKSIWWEYKAVRKEWVALKEERAKLGIEKPHFYYDHKEKRIRPSGRLTRHAILRIEEMKKYRRLVELASYLVQQDLLAPDFTADQLSRVRQPHEMVAN